MVSNIGLKRINRDLKNIQKNPIKSIKTNVDKNDITKIYFMFYDLNSCFQNGEYIGLLKLSNEHPFKPPDFFIYTPNGRFEIGIKICHNNTSFHESEWCPSWSIETLLIGFLSSFLDNFETGQISIGHLRTNDDTKIKFAQQSKNYNRQLDIYQKYFM